jgi:hypothetical protein
MSRWCEYLAGVALQVESLPRPLYSIVLSSIAHTGYI